MEHSSEHIGHEGLRAAVGDELIETNRQARTDLRQGLAEAEHTLGEMEHSVEERMLSVADMLSNSEDVRRRAHQLSADAEIHLARAARRRSEVDKRSTGGDGEQGRT